MCCTFLAFQRFIAGPIDHNEAQITCQDRAITGIDKFYPRGSLSGLSLSCWIRCIGMQQRFSRSPKERKTCWSSIKTSRPACNLQQKRMRVFLHLCHGESRLHFDGCMIDHAFISIDSAGKVHDLAPMEDLLKADMPLPSQEPWLRHSCLHGDDCYSQDWRIMTC